MDLIDIDLID